MPDSRRYYKDLVCYVLKRYFGVDAEATLPLGYGNLDLVCELPKELLRRPSPFPYLGEINLFYLKPSPGSLDKEDIMQGLGALYIAATSSRAQGKSITLTMLTAARLDVQRMSKWHVPVDSKEQPSVAHFSGEPRGREPWIYRLTAEAPAYVFVLDEIPMNKEEYWYFLPFQSRPVVEAYQRRYPRWHEHIKEFTHAINMTPENGVMLFWLKQLHPELYDKEIGVSLDRQEIAESLCPKVLQKVKEQGFQQGLQKGREEGLQEGIAKGLSQGVEQGMQKGVKEGEQQALPKAIEQGLQQGLTQGMQRAVIALLKKVGQVPDELAQRVSRINSLETLEVLLHTAANTSSLEEFDNQLRVIFWKYRN
jgi:hypothetical protein